MNIKTAGQYINKLDSWISNLKGLLVDKSYIYEINEKHEKIEGIEEVKIENVKEYDVTLDKISYLIDSLINEKSDMVLAIANAKQLNKIEIGVKSFDLDTAIQCNKSKREFAQNLNYLKDNKSKVVKTTTTGYKFNNEGNQVPYSYNLEKNYKLDFDEKEILSLYKSILTNCDVLSEKIDELMTRDIVCFVPNYNLHDSLEEIINR